MVAAVMALQPALGSTRVAAQQQRQLSFTPNAARRPLQQAARLAKASRRQAVRAAAAAAAAAAPAVRPEAEVPGMAEFLDRLKWDSNGLVVAIAQHADTGEVLMQAFADRAAVCETLQTG